MPPELEAAVAGAPTPREGSAEAKQPLLKESGAKKTRVSHSNNSLSIRSGRLVISALTSVPSPGEEIHCTPIS